MSRDDPLIHTGIGKISVSKAREYFRSELGRTPTADKPRDTAVLLGMLRAFSGLIKKFSALEVIENFNAHPHLFNFETARTLVREARMIAYAPHGADPSEWVCFGDLARNEMGQQCQYGSRYIDGSIEGWPCLGTGLRFRGSPENYHAVRMHVDDIPVFMQRYREFCEARLRA